MEQLHQSSVNYTDKYDKYCVLGGAQSFYGVVVLILFNLWGLDTSPAPRIVAPLK